MKFVGLFTNVITTMSHPVRGAWIEIMRTICCLSLTRSHPVRGAWIEILVLADSADNTG